MMKEIWKKYIPFFTDIWQYLAFIIVFIIGAIIVL